MSTLHLAAAAPILKGHVYAYLRTFKNRKPSTRYKISHNIMAQTDVDYLYESNHNKVPDMPTGAP